jgi:DNA-binding transcriptional MerR regulator
MEIRYIRFIGGGFLLLNKIVGLSEHTLRLYENEGLIKVNRDDKNVRIYSDENRLWMI